MAPRDLAEPATCLAVPAWTTVAGKTPRSQPPWWRWIAPAEWRCLPVRIVYNGGTRETERTVRESRQVTVEQDGRTPRAADGELDGGPTCLPLPSSRSRPRVLVVCGLDGDPGVMEWAAPRLFPDLSVRLFAHHRDALDGGIEGLAERALAVLDADEDPQEPAYVCGESFGGTVALTLARHAPHRVRGLILLSTFGWYPALSALGGRAGLLLWRLLGDSVAHHVLRAWRPISLPGAVGTRCAPDLARAFLAYPDLHLPGYRSKCEIALGFDARPWLGDVTCPAFVLTGTWDPVVPVSAGQALARRLPNARLYQLPGRHLVHCTRADEAAALIRRWREEVEGS